MSKISTPHPHHKRSQPTPHFITNDAATCLDAVTNPFKCAENTVRIPDGRGGESFASSDKLRITEDFAVWEQAVQNAATQWALHSHLFGDFDINENYTNCQFEPTNGIPIGWNIIECTADYVSSPPFINEPKDEPSGQIYVPDPVPGPPQLDYKWTNVEINAAYYFMCPGMAIPAAVGAMSGPSSNYAYVSPSSGRPKRDTDNVQPGNFDPWHRPTDEAALNAVYRQAEMMNEALAMTFTAPMQIYRVLNASFNVETSESQPLEPSGLLELAKLYEKGIISKDMLDTFANAARTAETDRKHALIITPLAGVEDWSALQDDLFGQDANSTSWIDVRQQNVAVFPGRVTAQNFQPLKVDSDFTYAEGHAGKLIGAQNLKTTATFDEPSQVSSVRIRQEGALAGSRRTVAAGMKMFSTEAAMLANGRVVGGELPLTLVQDLLTPSGDWGSDESIDSFINRVESRMADYTAYRAIDGITARYNPLQTATQGRYSMSRDGMKLKVDLLTALLSRTEPPTDEQDKTWSLGSFRNPLVAEAREYEPPFEGSEMLPLIAYLPNDPVTQPDTGSGVNDGLFFQAVLHTENLPTGHFPMGIQESLMDPNWDIYRLIASEPDNFPVVTSGHSFKSFFRTAKKFVHKAKQYGAIAMDVSEAIAPLL